MGVLSLKNSLKDLHIEQVCTQTDLLRRRGWTKALIKKWLTPIDKSSLEQTTYPNPKAILFYRKDVLKVEEDPLFQKEFRKPRKPGPKTTNKSEEVLNEVLQNLEVIYVDDDILLELLDNYIQIFIQSNSNGLYLATQDSKFTQNCLYKIIQDCFTSYKSDMEKLVKCNCNYKQIQTYRNILNTKIIEIYPQVKDKGVAL